MTKMTWINWFIYCKTWFSNEALCTLIVVSAAFHYGGVDCVCFAVRWILLRCNANVDPDPGSKKSAGKNKNNNTKFTGKILNFVFVFSDFWNCFRQFLHPWSASSLRILIQEVSHNADADPHHCHICTAGWTMLVSTGRTGSTPVSWLSLATRL